jgi:hypothetical protein
VSSSTAGLKVVSAGSSAFSNGVDRHCTAASHSPIPSVRQPTPTTNWHSNQARSRQVAGSPSNVRVRASSPCGNGGYGDATGSPSTAAARRRCRSASRRVTQTTPTNSTMPRPAARLAGTETSIRANTTGPAIPMAAPTTRWPSSPPMRPSSCRMVTRSFPPRGAPGRPGASAYRNKVNPSPVPGRNRWRRRPVWSWCLHPAGLAAPYGACVIVPWGAATSSDQGAGTLARGRRAGEPGSHGWARHQARLTR